MTMNRTTLLRTAAACALAFLALPREAGAALITWGTPTTIAADTDVSTTGSLLYAFTFGAFGVPSATVNGVTFAPFAIGNSSTTVGNVTLAPGLAFILIPVTRPTDPSRAPF